MNQWLLQSTREDKNKTQEYLEQRYQRPQTDRQRYKTSSEEKSPRWQVLPVKQFISTKDLGVLRMLAQERDVWEDLLNVICSA